MSRLPSVVLRVTAIAIAIAALIDPVFSISTAPMPPVVVIHATSSEVDAIDRALAANLKGRELVLREPSGNRLPCALDEQCVVIADGAIDVDWDTGDRRPISLVTVANSEQANVALQSVLLSAGHRAATGQARVVMSGSGVAGKRSEMRITDEGAVIGSAIYQWTTAATATIDVPWWPLEAGARALRVEAVPIDGEITAADNVIDAAVMVSATRLPILVFDAHPSWNSTFVRRAIEDDARFTVGYRSRIAPGLSAGTLNGRLDAAVLDAVAMVIIGGPEGLTTGEVALLDRYVRVRGGTVVLLPEQRASGASAQLFPGNAIEHLTANAESIGPLHATEILRWNETPVTSTVLARSGSLPAIVSTPAGNGRIVVSGAMDAWRYRQVDSGAFDRFWTSLVAQGAALGEGLTLTFDQGIAAAGSRARFTLRDRRIDPRVTTEASATSSCNNGESRAVRLWPGGTLGEFVGEMPAAAPGHCTIDASVGDRHVTGAMAIADRPARGTNITLAKLERLARASGGVVSKTGGDEPLVRSLDAAPPMSRLVSVHPMRAPWWIVPFAGCLSIEWWLRRRQGLR